VLDYSGWPCDLDNYQTVLRREMEKENLIKASYAEYQTTLFGACGIALSLGVFFADYLKLFAVWLLFFGIIIHSWGMYNVHERNKE
jgi:hypothetical protein